MFDSFSLRIMSAHTAKDALSFSQEETQGIGKVTLIKLKPFKWDSEKILKLFKNILQKILQFWIK